ncbi:MAG: GntR family transcriptional regulator, partial [Leucothrix sp.]
MNCIEVNQSIVPMTMWQPDISNYQNALYQAIADEIDRAVEKGALKAGDKLPTHRALADLLGVTVGTVTRGYAEAEKRGSVSARVGSGTFITPVGGQSMGLAILAREQRGKIDFSLNLPIPIQTDEMLQASLRDIAEDVPQLDLVGYQPEKGALRQREWAS